MAVAAEAVSAPPGALPEWSAALGVVAVAPQGWYDADAIPALQPVRAAARARAAAIREERMQYLREGEYDAVPIDVDPLTTAARVRAAEETFGQDSPEYHEAYAALFADTGRLLGEGYRTLTWEYFEERELTFDAECGGHQSHGHLLRDIVADGITPFGPQEEQDVRLGEYVEQATYDAIPTLGGLALQGVVKDPRPDLRSITMTQCTDWALASYIRNPKAGHGGYVPKIKKNMLRGVRFASGKAYSDTLALSGEFHTPEVVNAWLQELELVAPGEQLSKTEIRGKQYFNREGHDVFAAARRLDELASERSGQIIFLGEVWTGGPRDYAAARTEAAAREQALEGQTHELARYLLKVERAGTDHFAAQGLVARQVKDMIFSRVRHDVQAARVAFGDETAQAVERAQAERAAGNEDSAKRIERKALKEAPTPGFCGADGSCGLVEATQDEKAQVSEVLEASEDDEILRDDERPCENCGSVGTVFYNRQKVNRTCTNCNHTRLSSGQSHHGPTDK